jgi:hypothetical protein
MKERIKISYFQTVTFRITEADKMELNRITERLGITKSRFFREKLQNMLLTLKNMKYENGTMERGQN